MMGAVNQEKIRVEEYIDKRLEGECELQPIS